MSCLEAEKGLGYMIIKIIGRKERLVILLDEFVNGLIDLCYISPTSTSLISIYLMIIVVN